MRIMQSTIKEIPIWSRIMAVVALASLGYWLALDLLWPWKILVYLLTLGVIRFYYHIAGWDQEVDREA